MAEENAEMELEEITQFANPPKKKKILVGEKDIRVRRDNMEIIETLYNGSCNKLIKIKELFCIKFS